MIDVETILKTLAKTRPVFHSEADFQHSLAWLIHKQHPEVKVRLEYRPSKIDRKTYVDIWLEVDGQLCAIELKYKTRICRMTVDGEEFDLLNQAAQDIARYDVCKDICRIEALANKYPSLTGFAIFLTNDSTYWEPSKRDASVDSCFRLHRKELKGELTWLEHASAGTMRGRTAPLKMGGTYPIRWDEYSDNGERGGRFRVMVVKVQSA